MNYLKKKLYLVLCVYLLVPFLLVSSWFFYFKPEQDEVLLRFCAYIERKEGLKAEELPDKTIKITGTKNLKVCWNYVVRLNLKVISYNIERDRFSIIAIPEGNYPKVVMLKYLEKNEITQKDSENPISISCSTIIKPKK